MGRLRTPTLVLEVRKDDGFDDGFCAPDCITHQQRTTAGTATSNTRRDNRLLRSVHVNQQATAGAWFDLGADSFTGSAEVVVHAVGESCSTCADAVRGEQMLRPDFTVPVVQMHIDRGARAARYTYAGEVSGTGSVNGGLTVLTGGEVQPGDSSGDDRECHVVQPRPV